MLDPSKILIATQCTPAEPWKSEVLRLFKSLSLFGGKLKLAKKVACFSEPIDKEFENRLEELEVKIHFIEPLDKRYPYANKIQMLQIKEDYDILVALDTDVIITGDFSDFIDENKISAKGVDTDPLGLENWKKLFKFFKLDVPSERFQTSITNEKTIPWFNSGVLFIPKKFSSQLYNSWIKYNTKLLENYYSQIFLSENSLNHDHKFAFTDQYALALAIHDLKLPYEQLSLEYNFPTHYLIHESFLPNEIIPYIIHYHHKIALSENIILTPYKKPNEKINAVNLSLTGMSEFFLEQNPLNLKELEIDNQSKKDYSYEELIEELYQKILLRTADKEGMKYYKSKLENHTISIDEIKFSLLSSQERSTLENWHPRSISAYCTNKNFPILSKKTGNFQGKIAILTIPKSGTYLLSKILSKVGFEEVQINAQNYSIMDYRWTTMDDPLNLPYHIQLEISSKMILPGQILTGHIECNDYSKNHLKDFKKVFVYRNLRDGLVSLMRHAENWGNNVYERKMLQNIDLKPKKMIKFLDTYKMTEFLKTLQNRLKWINDSSTFHISFEEILGDLGKEIQHEKLFQLFEFVDVDIHHKNIDDILNQVINSKTLTWSGKRSNYLDYWNSEVESKFCELELDKINSTLGFDN